MTVSPSPSGLPPVVSVTDSYLCSVVRATVLTFHDDCTFGPRKRLRTHPHLSKTPSPPKTKRIRVGLIYLFFRNHTCAVLCARLSRHSMTTARSASTTKTLHTSASFRNTKSTRDKTDSRRVDLPLLQKAANQSRRCCASTTAVRHDVTRSHTLPPESEERPPDSMVQSALPVSAEVSSTSVESSDFQCRGIGLLQLRRCSSMGSQKVIPRTAESMGGKRQNSKHFVEPMNRSKASRL